MIAEPWQPLPKACRGRKSAFIQWHIIKTRIRPGIDRHLEHRLETGWIVRQRSRQIRIESGPQGHPLRRVRRRRARGDRDASQGFSARLRQRFHRIQRSRQRAGSFSPEDGEAAVREARPLFPPVAVRELTANALIHQDMTVTGAGAVSAAVAAAVPGRTPAEDPRRAGGGAVIRSGAASVDRSLNPSIRGGRQRRGSFEPGKKRPGVMQHAAPLRVRSAGASCV